MFGDKPNRPPRPGPSRRGNFNRRPSRPSPQPASRPPKPRAAKGPALISPKQPGDKQELRRMLKAAAWRLARFLRQSPAKILASSDPVAMVEQASGVGKFRKPGQGQARRLAIKIARLKTPAKQS